MSNRDQRLITMMDDVVVRGAASESEILIGMVYGNLKLEDSRLETETVITAVNSVLAQSK
jgi:hypothetical protein